jgi:hypothetical protein
VNETIGVFLREIGKNLYAWAYAHTVRVDKDDNIWATDKGSDMVGASSCGLTLSSRMPSEDLGRLKRGCGLIAG